MRFYLIAMSVLIGLALVMSGSNVGIAVLLLSLGLGAPLVFAATGVLYGLCAAPAVAFWAQGGVARAVGLALAALLIAAAALAPKQFGLRDAERIGLALRAADHLPAAPVEAASMEIRWLGTRYEGTFGGQGACGDECRALLSSGAVQWVRVVVEGSSQARGKPAATVYRALRGKDCAVPGGETPNDAARCVVVAQDGGERAELTIAFEELSIAPTQASITSWAQVVSARKVVADAWKDGEHRQALEQTEVSFTAPEAPTLLGPRFHDWNSEGVDFVRRSRTVNPITLAGVLTELGYPGVAPTRPVDPNAWRESIDDQMTREMIAVLDLSQSEPFNSEQMKPLFDWILHARNVETWTPDLVALLRRFVRDRRVRQPTFFDQIFERRAVVAKALLPDVLDVIALDGVNSDYTPARQAAYTLPRLEPDMLEPYAARILALLPQSRDVEAILLPVVGRLGVDPLPYLTPFDHDVGDRSNYSVNPRLIGACRSEKPWAHELIPPLRAEFQATSGPHDRDRRVLIAKALANLGDLDFVTANVGEGPDAARLLREIDAALKKPKPADTLCSGW